MEYFRPAENRGHVNLGWLDSKHSFSFGSYHDSNHMGVSVLRVINDDRVAPSMGFDTHGHENMEIISYVLSGAVQHADSMGNEHTVPAGDVQVMSAGRGITHSEFNPSAELETHFLQIWIVPEETETEPGYQQKQFEPVRGLSPIVTPDGREGSLVIRQDASVHRVMLDAGERIEFDAVRQGYLQVITGQASLSGHHLNPGDGFGFDASVLSAAGLGQAALVAKQDLHALYFDLPPI